MILLLFWGILAAVSDSSSIAELLERLARLDEALRERDARIGVLTARVAELEALLRKDSTSTMSACASTSPPPRAVATSSPNRARP